MNWGLDGLISVSFHVRLSEGIQCATCLKGDFHLSEFVDEFVNEFASEFPLKRIYQRIRRRISLGTNINTTQR